MGTRTYLALAVLIIALEASGQPYFSRTYDGFSFGGATIAPDSGLVLCGDGNKLLRLDREGNPLWTMGYTTSPGQAVYIHDVAWVGDSSFALVGMATNPGGEGTAMAHEVVSSSGVPVWGGQFSLFNGDELLSAERAPNGSVVICGYNWGLSNMWGYAVRSGAEPGSYSTPLRSYPNGMVAVIVDVAPTSDGGFVSVGYDEGLIIAYKVSASGAIDWSRSMPIGGVDFLSMHAVEGDAGSTYIATQSGGNFFRLIRLDANGAAEWSRKYTITPGSNRPAGLVRFPNGDLWIGSNSWLMACSAGGDVLWARSTPHPVTDMEATLEGDGVFLIGHAGEDGWLMRTDANGQVADCTYDTLVPLVTTETVVASSDGPPAQTNSLFGGEVNAAPGTVPLTFTDCFATSVQSVRSDQPMLRTYPIPFTELLNVELPATHDRVELIDARGAIQRSVRTSNQRSIVLHRQGLASGLYLLRVMLAGTPVAIQRVAVE